MFVHPPLNLINYHLRRVRNFDGEVTQDTKIDRHDRGKSLGLLAWSWLSVLTFDCLLYLLHSS